MSAESEAVDGATTDQEHSSVSGVRSVPRGPLILLIVLSVFTALNVFEHALHVFPDPVAPFFAKWATDTAFLLAAVIVGLRAILVDAERRAWWFVAAGLLLWGGGATYFTPLQWSGDEIPIPSPADGLWLSAYAMWYVGLIMLFRARVRNLDVRLWADGLIGALAVSAIGAAIVFEAVLDSVGGSTSTVVTIIAYPLVDLLLLALIVAVSAMASWRVGSLGWIAAGLITFAIGDCVFLYLASTGRYHVDSWLDSVYPIAATLMAIAAWAPAKQQSAVRQFSMITIAIPIAFGVGSLAILVYDHFEQTNALALVLATLAMAAVLLRLANTFGENLGMLRRSQVDAMTDSLTGLPNRRKLMDDLERLMPKAATGGPFVLASFDLDGFKKYNDTFGHPAGDEMLRRLGERLAARVAVDGTAYRVGGDEFYVLYREVVRGSHTLVDAAAAALSDHGDAFTVTCSHGTVTIRRGEHD
ncbi:MAG: diguanylate cyclase domain-containing protein [Solirubrobacterales bacterium]